jgi:hypothetical protein
MQGGGEGRIWRGRRFMKGNHSTGIMIFLGGFSWITERGVEFCSWIGSVQAPVC